MSEVAEISIDLPLNNDSRIYRVTDISDLGYTERLGSSFWPLDTSSAQRSDITTAIIGMVTANLPNRYFVEWRNRHFEFIRGLWLRPSNLAIVNMQGQRVFNDNGEVVGRYFRIIRSPERHLVVVGLIDQQIDMDQASYAPKLMPKGFI